jgi:DNA-binding LacI/PurR family transcriptional regulator
MAPAAKKTDSETVPPLPSGRITQRQLAKLAGVSMTTIYNSLHQPELVKEATLKRLQKIMKDYDYTPDALAQAMVRGKSNIISIVVPRLDVLYFAKLVCEIESTASANGYKCLIMQHYDEPAKAMDQLRLMHQYRADGLILRCCSRGSDPDLVRRAQQYNFPLVLLDEEVQGFEKYRVGSDDYNDARKIMSILLEHGHRRIAYLAWHRADSDDLGPRFSGYRSKLLDAGLEVDPKLVERCKSEYGSGREEIKRLWKRNKGNLPTAVCCYSDQSALGALAGLHELGVKVPEEVSVVGFGGYQDQSLLMKPLTTIKQDLSEIARKSCEILIDQIQNGRNPQGPFHIPSELILGTTIS